MCRYIGAFFPLSEHGLFFLSFISKGYSSFSKSMSSSASQSAYPSSIKAFISRPSRLVGRPCPLLRAINPLIRDISNMSYCSFGVMFSRYSGTNFAPILFSASASTLNVYVIGGLRTATSSPTLTVRAGVTNVPFFHTHPFLQAFTGLLGGLDHGCCTLIN